MHQGKDMIGETGRIRVMLLNPQVGLVLKEAIQDEGCVTRGGVDDRCVERRVLIGDMGIELHARLRSVTRIHQAAHVAAPTRAEVLPIGRRRRASAPPGSKGLAELGVHQLRQSRSIGLVANMPGLQPR